METKNIKIFVSLRTDMQSELIDNKLYYPIRCGAFFDKNNSNIPGDNTGDNISKKKPFYSELTVQYWAWKNVEADYYGLCHYRRYLSFSNKTFPIKKDLPGGLHNFVIADVGIPREFLKYGLLDEQRMREIICKNDLIISEGFLVKDCIKAFHGHGNKVKDWWNTVDRIFIEKENIERLRAVLKDKYPQYLEDFDEYMNNERFLGYNCFIMKREYFFELCEFEFNILFELEKNINMDNYSETLNRTLAYFSEILYSVWVYHKRKHFNIKVEERQLVLFEDIEKRTKWKDLPSDEYITIVFFCDNDEYLFFKVTLKSLIHNIFSEGKYHLIIFYRNLEKEYINDIQEAICNNSKNVVVDFYDCNMVLYSLIDKRTEFVSPKFNLLIYLPYILQDKENAIFVKSGTIFEKCDLKELLRNKNFLVKAVKDIELISRMNWKDRNIIDRYRLMVNDPYNMFCEELVVFNFKKIRENPALLLGKINSKLDSYLYKNKMPQVSEFLNIMYQDIWTPLPLSWNYQCYERNYEKVILSSLPVQLAEEYIKCKDCVKLYTYKSIWENNLYNIKYSRFFWKYGRLCEEYEALFMRLCNYSFQGHSLSFARRVADKFLPKGSKRRNVVKMFIPRDSLQWKILKKIYHTIALD